MVCVKQQFLWFSGTVSSPAEVFLLSGIFSSEKSEICEISWFFSQCKQWGDLYLSLSREGGGEESYLSSFCRKFRLEYDSLLLKVFPPPLPSSGGFQKALSGVSLRTLLHHIKIENRAVGIYVLHSLFTSRAEYFHQKAFFKTKCFQITFF